MLLRFSSRPAKLHAVDVYPRSADSVHLTTMSTMSEPVGKLKFSNHHGTEKSIGEQILKVAQTIGDLLLLLLGVVYSFLESIYKTISPSPLKPVKGEIVVITGAGHGMGKELSLLYAFHGATVVGLDINLKSLEETINEINQAGHSKAYSFYCDVSDRESVFKIAKTIEKEIGDVTILINNAGVMPTHPILQQTQEEIQRVFSINVFANFWTIQAFLPAMKKNNKGHIVALSSVAGLFGLENLVPYCGSKFAVRGFMEALHEELRAENSCVDTTTICPYMVDTGLCKRPKIRFETFMPLVKPKYAAKAIMNAQRSNMKLVSIPRYLTYFNNIMRLIPHRAALIFKDFLNAGVESDL